MLWSKMQNEVEGLDQGPSRAHCCHWSLCINARCSRHRHFWQNILDSKYHAKFEHEWIGPVDHFLRDGALETLKKATHMLIGAVVEGYEFDWRRWKQPPGTLAQIDLAQQWAVSVAASAIEHAGYDGEIKDIDRLRTGVAFANALGGKIVILQTSAFIQTTPKR